MSQRNRQRGFSAAEVLIAVGILGVAMIFVAGVFPVGIRLTQVSMDRTTAALVANEAFAKVRLCSDEIGPQLSLLRFGRSRDFNDWADAIDFSNNYLVDANTFSWPTDVDVNFPDKEYCWSTLLRRTDAAGVVIDPNDPNTAASLKDVQVTVFVCRRAGRSVRYYRPDLSRWAANSYGGITDVNDVLPQPVRVEVHKVPGKDNELEIRDATGTAERTLIDGGDLIVDDVTGRIYRVAERYKSPYDHIILLDRDFVWTDWYGTTVFSPTFVWVVPPAAPMSGQRGLISGMWQVSGRSPCVAIYQKVVRF